MPNWTDDEGTNWFNKLECKRCLGLFEIDSTGEIPVHSCLGSLFKSVTYLTEHGRVEYHEPVRVEHPKRK